MAFKSNWNSRSFQTFSCHQDWLAEIHLKQTSSFLCIVPAPKNKKKNWHFNSVFKGSRVWGPATQSLKHNCTCQCLLLTFLKWHSYAMCYYTWFSDLSFRFSSFTASTLWDKSKRDTWIQINNTQSDSFEITMQIRRIINN